MELVDTEIVPRPDVERSPYVYRPLDFSKTEIRVLRVEPGAWADPLVCSLHTYHLEDASYDCLSYTWLGQTPDIDIIVDGLIFKVISNVEAALRRLREKLTCSRSNTSLDIWIDGICINQSDNTEKGQQVAMMSLIYAKAEMVHIWLGEISSNWLDEIKDLIVIESVLAHSYSSGWREELEDWINTVAGSSSAAIDFETQHGYPLEGIDLSSLASAGLVQLKQVTELLALLNLVLTRKQDVIGDALGFHSPKTGTGDIAFAVEIPPVRRGALMMWLWILKRTWWTRLWVVQEASLPRENPLLHFGPFGIEFGQFLDASVAFASWIKPIWYSTAHGFSFGILSELYIRILFPMSMKSVRKVIQSGHHPSLEEMSDWTRFYSASHPADSLFATLGLLDPGLIPLIKPDYSARKTVGQIFSDATKALIQFNGDLRHLHHATKTHRGEGKGQSALLPSWSLDWSRGQRTYILREACGRKFTQCSFDAFLRDSARQSDEEILAIDAAYSGQNTSAISEFKLPTHPLASSLAFREAFQRGVQGAVGIATRFGKAKFPEDGRVQNALFQGQFRREHPDRLTKIWKEDPMMLTIWCQSMVDCVDDRIGTYLDSDATGDQKVKADVTLQDLDAEMRFLFSADDALSFLVTSEGKLGFALFPVRPGAELYAIPGCHHAAVLEPRHDDGPTKGPPGTARRYTFQGFCYLEDFDMHKIIPLPEGSPKCEHEEALNVDNEAGSSYGELRQIELC